MARLEGLVTFLTQHVTPQASRLVVLLLDVLYQIKVGVHAILAEADMTLRQVLQLIYTDERGWLELDA